MNTVTKDQVNTVTKDPLSIVITGNISLKITSEIKRSIINYRKAGIDIEVLSGDIVKIHQARLINGYILSNKQLYDRAKEIFKGQKPKIQPVVYSLDVSEIDIEWINGKMDEFGIKRNDLIGQMGIDKSTLSLIFSKGRSLTKSLKASFFYYFLTYELNRDLRGAM